MKYLSLSICIFLSLMVKAQTQFVRSVWGDIDTALYKNAQLSELSAKLNTMYAKAMQEGKYFDVAHCLNYELKIADLRTEDTLYFKNSAFIDEILLQAQLPIQLQYALHLMQADRLKKFTKRYNKFQRSRYERIDIPVNYAIYDNDLLDSIAQIHFEVAKSLAKKSSDHAIDDALWLSSDLLQFLYKPDLFDIAIAEQIETVKTKYYYRETFLSQFTSRMGLEPDLFISKVDSTLSTANKSFQDIRLYKEWMNYQKAQSDRYYFVEMIMRKYINDLLGSAYDKKPSGYENYLLQQTHSQFSIVKAYSVYQLALLWNSQASKYFPGDNPIYIDGIYKKLDGYDTIYQYQSVKALQLFNQHRLLLDSFAYLKNILISMEAKINSSDALLSLQQNNVPGKPILAEFKFKNVDTLYYKVVTPGINYLYNFPRKNSLLNDLLRQQEQKNTYLLLPTLTDHNYHNTYIDLGIFPIGNHAIVFSNKPLSDTSGERDFLQFSVTNITVVNNDKRIYILDRQTGKPLTGANVKATYKRNILKNAATVTVTSVQNLVVNEKGTVEIKNANYSDLQIMYGNDTLKEEVNVHAFDEESDEEVYNKEDYDDLVDFYETNTKAYIYTDRSIYRPGQTVFYKAIFITKNKDNGKPMLLTKKNMKGKLLGSVFKKYLKEEDPYLFISDPFNKNMDSLKIIPNDFGSVNGSFKIPLTAATGQWDIEPDLIDVENSSSFRVEEYKRPSYEINIEKPKKELKLADSFTVKVKVRSFAGASLNNVKINYDISRNAFLDVYDAMAMETQGKNVEEDLVDTTGYTDNNGELAIVVKDTAILRKVFRYKDNWSFTYNIHAEAIDATGESYETRESVALEAKPIKISLQMNDQYERNELKQLPISATDKNAGKVIKTIHIKVYRIVKDTKLYSDRNLTTADVWLYDKLTLQHKFPFDNMLHQSFSESKELLYEKDVTTGGNGKLMFDSSLLVAGSYKLEAECKEDGKLKGSLYKYFKIYDAKAGKLAEPSQNFSVLPFNSAFAGETLKYYFGNSETEMYSVFHIAYLTGKKRTKFYYEEQLNGKGIHLYHVKIPDDAVGTIKITELHILNNQVFTNTQSIYVDRPLNDRPEIIIEKYRKILTPGGKETFVVSIKTKNEHVAAELMTTMYDASLDKLEQHRWKLPDLEERRAAIDVDWTRSINSINKNYSYGKYYYQETNSRLRPLWWLNPLDYAYEELGSGKSNFGQVNSLKLDYTGNDNVTGLWPNNKLTKTTGLEEVIVTGYDVKLKADNLSSVSSLRIRGVGSITSYTQPLIIIDGEPYDGDLSKFDANLVTDGLVLNGAEATALYGQRAAKGVLIISTKGPIFLPKEPEPVMVPRKNFNETAFFFPAVHADRDGYYSFSFTMPESVTAWNWKLLSHTKNLLFSYAERKLNSQLPLMVQPNMPRLLYQGDKIVLRSRITNLDTVNANGKVICKIEDAVTGADISAQLVDQTSKDFSVLSKQNISTPFSLIIPTGQTNPIKITISVRSQNFADGEEHTIPILSPKIFVRSNQAFSFTQQDTTLSLAPLPAGAVAFGIGLSLQPKPQAALINSLPALANYPYGCAEQTFNKLLARTTAYKLMRNDTAIRSSFEKTKQFIQNEHIAIEKLPDELSEETMPWLQLNNQNAMQQKQLFALLDTSQSVEIIRSLTDKLFKMQNVDGGLSWFDGGKSDTYISNYVLRGLGKLAVDKQLLPEKIFNTETYNRFLKSLVQYCDNQFVKPDVKNNNFLHYTYCRSYLLTDYPIADSIRQTMIDQLKATWKKDEQRSLYTNALLIISSFRYAKNEQDILYINAVEQLRFLEQSAIVDEQNGLRWKQLADDDDLTNSAEETITLLAEAFAMQKNNAVNKGIIKWILTAKNEHSWSNTKATAAAINLLATENKTASNATTNINLNADKMALSVSNDLLLGNPFAYSASALLPSALQLHKADNVATTANVYSYYFSNADNLTQLNKEVQLKKKWYKWNVTTNSWESFSSGAILKIADKIKVEMTIETSKPLQYVFIDDKRAAAFEPLENNSGYEYEDDMGYYRSIRDAGSQFFIDLIPSGRHTISYEMKVAQEGEFTNGIAILQCMYKPEITAYSNGSIVNSKP